jgi:hypothetical protein
MKRILSFSMLLWFAGNATSGELPAVTRSARSGPWSASATWEGGKVPAAGARVLIRTGHKIVYDVKSEQVIRAINIAGTLSFATDRDTRLDVGLIVVGLGDRFTTSTCPTSPSRSPLSKSAARIGPWTPSTPP